MVMFKKIKTFALAFSEPEKVYSSGEKVAGRVTVEVAEVTRVTCVKILACGVAKVLWIKGPQQCKQEMEYLRYEDVLTMDGHPAGKQSILLLAGLLFCLLVCLHPAWLWESCSKKKILKINTRKLRKEKGCFLQSFHFQT